ncbi:diguanylate cyclase domain-containing protein [Allosediminivita pacifica]|uniref:Diguanylate cyclase (GGDEF)-like protein n=1 Tax=Allosediminivita pacifica TaxID=1267769 RepID=A0A2T6ABL9_9RHOB|nr:diguanylate cyclase [Allosediminivita pacifica]PTX41208.1 diguanylate cyclase (GGDEF)-like protein [Allosediminivita pacifica]GGB24423.1 GGDEF domain-containing protein [Allosediminivita pacifica]
MMVDPEILMRLLPMHARLNPTGHILQAGPTLTKLSEGRRLVGCRFLEVFEICRPRAIKSMEALLATPGRKLHMRLRDRRRTQLKGFAVPDGSGGAVLDLSFGISVVDAVRDYGLTSTDFSPTDLTIEMLYLVEAKSAAMEASRTLNKRLEGAKIAAEERAFTDTLTGLRNRRACDHVLDRRLRNREPFALMQVDLDFFKQVNDSLGHAAGDHVLRQVAGIMLNEVRQIDTVARVGGDEFLIVLDGITDHAILSSIARRLIERIESPIPYEGEECRISASIGIAINRGDQARDSLCQQTDLALYASKRGGRGRHQFYNRTAIGAPGLPRDPSLTAGHPEEG